jgi:hypothetical protein
VVFSQSRSLKGVSGVMRFAEIIPVRAQRDFLQNLHPGLGWANYARRRCGIIYIPLPRNVIEIITAFSRAGPDTQAEVSILGGAGGIMISVPSLCHCATALSITTPPLTGTGSPF